MNLKLQKLGNSIGLKLPKEIVKKANLSTNSEITIKYDDHKIVIFPKKKTLKFKDLLSKITKDNTHSEILYDRVGREVW